MTRLLRALGFLSWIGCLLVLAYQASYWVIKANWPTVTLLDGTQNLFGVNLASLFQGLPIEYGYKAAYFVITTELSVALWWTGALFFGLTFILKIVFGK